MKNFYHKKMWNSGLTQVHAETPLTPLIKIKHGNNSYKDLVKLKLCRDPTSEKSDLYELNTALSEYGEPEEFQLFVWNFNMTLAASGKLEMDAKVQYIRTLVHGESLRQFDLLSADVEGENPLTVENKS